MDIFCVETPAGLNVNLKKGKKRKRRKGKKKASDGCVEQSMDQKDENVHDFKSGENVMVAKACLQVNLLQLDAVAKLSEENPLTSMDPTANPMEKPTKSQKNRWRRAKKKALSKLRPESGENVMVAKTCLQDNLPQLDAIAKLSEENPLTSMDPAANTMEKPTKSQKNRWRRAKKKALSKLGPESGENVMVAKACLQDNLLQLDAVAKLSEENPLTSTDPTANPMEKPTKSQKNRWRRAKKKALSKLGPESMDHASIISNLSMADASDASAGGKINNETAMSQESTEKGSAVSFSGPLANLEQKGVELVKNHTRSSSPSLFKISSHNICHRFSQERVESQSYLLAVPYHIPQRRKLLILDVNGLLADIVMPPPRGCKADINIYRHAVFKRPFYLDFLKFCFERFDVGVWSSRKSHKLYRMVDYLFGDLKHKLSFVWDARFCTKSRFYTPENRHKPIVFKELQKLWEKHDPNLPWEKGDYDESNTLLLDDSPYKALLNPMHTGVFPFSYSYKAEGDSSLGPGGDVRVYLEGLAVAESVQHYVAHHPFGQSAINETNPCWNFYSEVLQSFLIQSHKRV